MLSRTKVLFGIVGIVVVGFVVLQFIPVEGRGENPPVTYTVQWDSPETEALVRQACYDCHSNETAWLWYLYIAPVSWLVAKDVREGCAAMNFSTGREVESG